MADDDWTPHDLQRHDEILDRAVEELRTACVEEQLIPHVLILHAVEFLSDRPIKELEFAERLIADLLTRKRAEFN